MLLYLLQWYFNSKQTTILYIIYDIIYHDIYCETERNLLYIYSATDVGAILKEFVNEYFEYKHFVDLVRYKDNELLCLRSAVIGPVARHDIRYR